MIPTEVRSMEEAEKVFLGTQTEYWCQICPHNHQDADKLILLMARCLCYLQNIRSLRLQILRRDGQPFSFGLFGASWLGFALKHHNRSLTHLDLSHNFLSDVGVEPIALALTENQVLRGLVLRENEIGPKGARVLATVLQTNNTLQKLDLSKNYSLHQHNEEEEEDAPLAHAMQVNQGLRVLLLEGTSMGSACSQRSIRSWQEALSNNNTLEVLDLSDNYHVMIGRGDNVELSDVLRYNKSLRVLHFDRNHISSTRKLMTNLELLPLETLTLDHVDLLERELSMHGGQQQERVALCRLFASGMASKTSLRFLSLVGCCLGDNGVCILNDMVLCPNKGSLQRLNLSSNNIGCQGASDIAYNLNNNTLEELILDDNAIRDEGGIAFAEAMASSSEAPMKLSLRNNEMGPSVGRAFGRILSTGTSRLFRLDAYQNCLGDEGVQAICHAMRDNADSVVLEEINVGLNDTKENAVLAMAEAIERSPANVLTRVTIGSGDSGFGVVKQLASAVYEKRAREQTPSVVDIVGDEDASLFFQVFQLIHLGDRNETPTGIIPWVLARVSCHCQDKLHQVHDEMEVLRRLVKSTNLRFVSQASYDQIHDTVERRRIDILFAVLSSAPHLVANAAKVERPAVRRRDFCFW